MNYYSGYFQEAKFWVRKRTLENDMDNRGTIVEDDKLEEYCCSLGEKCQKL